MQRDTNQQQAAADLSTTDQPGPVAPYRWRESAHEYDFGPTVPPALEQPRRRWRESAHEYDFGGERD